MATLYVVATPIGNLEDITLRALSVLKEVDTILCEDTRVTRKLLQKYSIGTPTVSYHAQSSLSKTDFILAELEAGKNLALVSDAGTPAISDPGSLLISKIRERFSTEEVSIVAVPGASALTALLSIAGVPCHEFIFLGFLPHKKGRETLFKEMAVSTRTMVFYESPHRILKTLEALVKFLPEEGGAFIGSKKVTVGRELTKIYEETIAGTAAEVLAYFTNTPEKVRGEFVVIVS